jgi:uncharacterized repeat protein (TIGR01451 family)
MRRLGITAPKWTVLAVMFALFSVLATGLSSLAGANTVLGCKIVTNPKPTHFTNCPGANLSGTNLLSTINLSYANLSGANLTGANLGSSNLTNANLSNANLSTSPAGFDTQLGFANLSGANLSGANLTNASLSSAILSNANLTNAVLVHNDVSSANLTGATLTGVSSGGLFGTPAALPAPWIIAGGYLIGPGANLTGANLTGADLTGATLTGANLTNAILTRVNLTGANLTNAVLTNAVLTSANVQQANFSGATLTDVTSGSLTGVPSSLPAGWSIVNGYLIGPGASTILTESESVPGGLAPLAVTFTYSEYNSGHDAIANVQVTSSLCSGVTFVSSSDGNTAQLNPGATWTFACSTTITTPSPPTGDTDNSSATGIDVVSGLAVPTGNESSSATVHVN